MVVERSTTNGTTQSLVDPVSGTSGCHGSVTGREGEPVFDGGETPGHSLDGLGCNTLRNSVTLLP